MKRNEYKKRKKRKKRLWLKVLFIFTVIILAITGYSYFQYKSGLKMAGDTKLGEDSIEFNGKKDSLGKVNVLLLGIDTRGEEKSRTDTIMIGQYDPESEKLKLVSIMRDIYAEIPGHDNYKINTAFFLGGPELLRQTLKQNFGIDVEYYAIVDFKGFQSAVDTLAPNGIEIDVEKRMSKNIGITLQPGLQMLNGKELLGYARFRYDAEGDFGRVERQQKVIGALKDEAFSVSGITKLPKLIGTIQPYVETNLSKKDMLAILKKLMLNPVDNIEKLRIPIDDSYTDARYDHAGAVLEIDFDANRTALDQFLNGTTNDAFADSENESQNSN